MKIIHIFAVKEKKFLVPLIDVLSKDQKNVHYFLTRSKEIYEELKTRASFISDECVYNASFSKLINEYADDYEFVFLHGLCGVKDFLKIRKRYLKKIVWRTWGGDTGYEIEKKAPVFEKIAKRLMNHIFVNRINKIRLIGIANIVDEYNIRRKKITVNSIPMPYSRGNTIDILKKEKYSQREESTTKRVMIGHSGYSICNHLEIINKMRKFIDDQIQLILVLSYGDQDYIKNLVEQVNTLNLKKYITIIDRFMTVEEYYHFLNEIDIAIFDGKISYALGNISALMFFGKKIFLNKEGIMAKTFEKEKIPFAKIEDLESMNYSEFVEKSIYTEDCITKMIPSSYQQADIWWKIILENLENVKS